mgnify:CR=1 FL=1
MVKVTRLLVIMGVFSVGSMVPALANAYVTSKGAQFLKIADAWVVAPDGTRWSNNQGQFSNQGPSNQDRLVSDSAATRACNKIAAKLPTVEQYENLKKYFELDSNGYLTERGRKDMIEVFPDMKKPDGFFGWFWSSSVHQYNSQAAYTFLGLDGDFNIFFREVDEFFVRCVSSY